MSKNINEFIRAFHESDECKRIMRDGSYSIGVISREEIIACARSIAMDYADAQMKAYHRWMTDDELP